MVHVLLMLCQLAKLFATRDLQRNPSSGIVLRQWFFSKLLQEHSRPNRTASRLPCAASKSNGIRKAEGSNLCEKEKDIGNV